MHQRSAVLVVPALEDEQARRIGLGAALLEEHLRERRQDHRDVDDLLADRDPVVSAVHGDDVEEEPADEREDRDPLLVLLVVEPQAPDRADRGRRFVHFGFRWFHSSISLRANTVPSASSSCMK